MWLLSFLQITFGLLFSLFIPGFLLDLIIFKEQDRLERVACSIFFSLFISLILSLFLSWPILNSIGNLSLRNISIGLFIISVGLLVINLFKSNFHLSSVLLFFKKIELIRLNWIFIGLIIVQLLLLLYIQLLSYCSIPSFIFHIIYLGGIITIVGALLCSKLSVKQKLFLIIFWVVSLQLITSLRQPSEIVSNYPDMLYELQIIDYIKEANQFNFDFQTTGQAIAYKYNPGLELILALISYFGINPEFLIKFFFLIVNSLTLVFLFLLFRNFMKEEYALASLLIAGSCFWFIHFESFTNHQSLALLSFVILLFSFSKNSSCYYLLSVIAIFMIIITHHFSSLIMPLILIFSWLFERAIALKFNFTSKCHINVKLIITFFTISIIWLIFSNPLLLSQLSGIIHHSNHFAKESVQLLMDNPKSSQTIYFSGNNSTEIYDSANLSELSAILSNSKSSSFRFMLLPTISPLKHLGVILIAYLGVFIFGILALFGIITSFKEKNQGLFSLLPFALSSLSISIIFVILWSIGFNKSNIVDLFNRQFMYSYFTMAPLVVYLIYKLKNKLLIGLILSVILVSAIYQGTPPFYYENSNQIVDTQDVRLNLIQWKNLGLFLRENPIEERIWGDKLAFSFIGSYSRKEVQMFYNSLNLRDWKLIKSDSLIALRASLVNISNNNMFISNLDEIKSNNDLIYSTKDIFLVNKV